MYPLLVPAQRRRVVGHIEADVALVADTQMLPSRVPCQVLPVDAGKLALITVVLDDGPRRPRFPVPRRRVLRTIVFVLVTGWLQVIETVPYKMNTVHLS